VKIPLFVVGGLALAATLVAFSRFVLFGAGHDLFVDSMMVCAAAAVGMLENGAKKR